MLVGRIGGSANPWIDGRAAFTLLDASMTVIAEGGDSAEGELCTGDCCATERLACTTLVKVVEDRRDDLVVIAAGYPDEMADFIGANPGLASRFPKTIHFPDYTDDELWAIFEVIAEKAGYRPDDEAEAAARAWFASIPRDKGFGNGRLARNLFEDAVARQAGRVVAIDDPTDEQLTGLTGTDIAPVGEGPRHRS